MKVAAEQVLCVKREDIFPDGAWHGFVTDNPVTVPSVLCANLIPYTPSVDLSFPAVTKSAFLYVPTTVPLIEQVTLSPFTDTAIS